MDDTRGSQPALKPPPVDRASESVVSSRVPPPPPSPDSSGQIEISPASFTPDSLAGTSPASTVPLNAPPRAAAAHDAAGLSLRALVGIAGGVLLVLSALALLLFR
jgi:hypothetical protein